MNILLVRPKYDNLFFRINLINVEPLELEYLYTILNNDGHNCVIYDGQVEKHGLGKALREFKPDIVAISGYIAAVNKMIQYSEIVKEYNPQIKVAIGGVHAELNYADFYVPTIDYVIHSGGYEPFRKIIDCLEAPEQIAGIKGICRQNSDGTWVFNEREIFCPKDLPIPDRSHFYKYKKQFNYLLEGSCAVVKTAYGCPHNCSFCYCCLLNGGKYLLRDMEGVVDEIYGIDCNLIWIVDDTFTVDRERILKFTELIRARGIKKRFIMYGRSDFISENEDMIEELADIGVVDFIVGLEAVLDNELQDYNKCATVENNQKCVEILHKYGIECLGLFIIGTDATKVDFDNLIEWVKRMKLKFITASVFTPFPGTPLFEKYKEQLTTLDYDNWDLLHLVIKPGNMTEKKFYYELYKLYAKVAFVNKGIGDFNRQYISYILRVIKEFIGRLIRKN
jgi:radical SAM superfamily enzyme YgiQ (UPF0313 family)